MHKGFLNRVPRPPETPPVAPGVAGPDDPSASSASRIRREPPPASSDTPSRPTRFAKTAAVAAITRKAPVLGPSPRAVELTEKVQSYAENMEKRKAALLDFFALITDKVTELEHIGAMGTDSADIFLAAAHAGAAQLFAPPGSEPPTSLITALREWDPSKEDPYDKVRFNSTPRQSKPSYARAAASAAPARTRPSPPSLRPLQGFRLRGQRVGSAERAADKGDHFEDRVFVRLGPDSASHPARLTALYILRRDLEAYLHANGAPSTITIGHIKRTATGISLRSGPHCSGTELFQFKDLIQKHLSAQAVDMHGTWTRFVIENVPTYLDGLQISDELLAEEVQHSFGAPVMEPPRRLGRPEDLSLQRTSSVLVSLAPNSFATITGVVDLFCGKCPVRLYKEQRATESCSNCLSYDHTDAACRAATRCSQCGEEGHSEGQVACSRTGHASTTVEAIPRCCHCFGPHPALDPTCLARPQYCKEQRRVLIPAGLRLAGIRSKGQRRFAAEHALRQVRQAAAQASNGKETAAASAGAVSVEVEEGMDESGGG